MMKKYVIFLLLLAVQVSALAPDINSHSAVVDLNISSSLDIISSFGSRVDYVDLNVFFYPKNIPPRQSVLSLDAVPDGQRKDERIYFDWKLPRQNSLNFIISSRVKIVNEPSMMSSKVDFPFLQTDLSDTVRMYLSSSEIIDSDNPEIRKLAFSIAENEYDAFILVNKIAFWVKHSVRYDLSTINSEASLKASEVLKNRDGVCDEITSLFIALLRALGIPAKFVSGIAYTDNLQFSERWGAHGWAEVYFPGYGWMPFDVTFGQHGWLDAFHIKLQESLDPNQKSLLFSWKSDNPDVKIQSSPVKINALLAEQGSRLVPFLNLNGRFLKESAGFGSYDAVMLDISNPNNFYYATELQMADVDEVEKLDKKIGVVLGPKEKKSFVWKFKIKDNLSADFVYEIPVLFYTSSNQTFKLGLKSSGNEKIYSLNDITRELSFSAEQKEKKDSDKIDLSCFPVKNYFYPYEKLEVKCGLTNLANQKFDRLEVCLVRDCRYEDLGIAQSKEFVFELANFGTFGRQEFSVVAKNNNVAQKSSFFVDVYAVPKIEISSVKYPESIKYGEDLILELNLAVSSYTGVSNITVEASNRRKSQVFIIPFFAKEKALSLKMPKSLVSENLSVKVKWLDLNGKSYSTSKDISLAIEGRYFWNTILDFFYDFFASLKESFV